MSTRSHGHHEHRNPVLGGLLLITVGILALVAQFVPDSWGLSFGLLVLLGLGAAFIIVGILTRAAGWFIPGGILTGIGAGIALTDGPLAHMLPANLLPGDEGGLFMLAFAGGWFLITVLTALFTDETQWWPLIPGAIMALIGLAAGFGSIFATMLKLLGDIWPVALILAGLYILLAGRRSRRHDATDTGEKFVEKA